MKNPIIIHLVKQPSNELPGFTTYLMSSNVMLSRHRLMPDFIRDKYAKQGLFNGEISPKRYKENHVTIENEHLEFWKNAILSKGGEFVVSNETIFFTAPSLEIIKREYNNEILFKF
jgi:hypothetical protein